MPKVRRSETYPLPGTIDEILDVLGRIMALGEVEHISLNEGEPIYVERFADMANPGGLDDPSFTDFTLEDMLARIPLEEYVAPHVGMSPAAQLFEMFLLVGAGTHVVTHVLCSSRVSLRRWLGMEEVLADDYKLLGAAVVEVPMFPSDAVVVFGANRAGAPASEVKVALKLTVIAQRHSATDPQPNTYGLAPEQVPMKEFVNAQQQQNHGLAGPTQHHPEGHDPAPGTDGPATGGDYAPAWFGPAD